MSSSVFNRYCLALDSVFPEYYTRASSVTFQDPAASLYNQSETRNATSSQSETLKNSNLLQRIIQMSYMAMRWQSTLLVMLFFNLTHGLSEEYPKLLIRAPAHESLATLPVHFRCEIITIDTQAFLQEFGANEVCIEIDGVRKRCHDLASTDMILHDLSHGPHTARVFMEDPVTREPILATNHETVFTVVTRDEMQQHLVEEFHRLRTNGAANATENGLIFHPVEQGLVDWARSRRQSQPHHEMTDQRLTDASARNGPYLLVIGVKTSLENGFAYRQTIRETWAKTLPENVKLWFVGCQFDPSSASPPSQEVLQAIELEKRTFGDMLTTEVDCIDSYYQLVQKTTSFLSFAVQNTAFEFAMIIDDDIYLRVDVLVHGLLENSPKQRFFAGQVWSTQLGRPVRPQRDKSSKNYLSKFEYPMSELPPFAIGPHYIISRDCAEFVARNRHQLAGVGTLEDVSMSIWLLALQVHPQHITNFHNLNDFPCENDLISFSDLSCFGIRTIHDNLKHSKAFCDGFSELWSKPTYSLWIPIPEERIEVATQYEVQPVIQLLPEGSLELEVTITTSPASPVNAPKVMESLTFQPAHESILSVMLKLCSVVNVENHEDACLRLQRQFLDDLTRMNVDTVDSSRLALLRHNLQVAQQLVNQRSATGKQPIDHGSEVRIVYSPMAQYIHVVLENLFVIAFGGQRREIVVVPEFAIPTDQSPIEVLVFSVLDGGCGSSYAVECQQQAAEYIRKYKHRVRRFVLLSGEAWELNLMPVLAEQDMVLLTTQRVPPTPTAKHLYLPVASTSFGERMKSSPVQLLRPSSSFDLARSSQRSKFCAYMYARCDRPQREYMFDLLNSLEPVEALGACQGSSSPPNPLKRLGRIRRWYNDEAVQLFGQYKFVIAFENAQEPGYITEKIVNAFLAGSVPVYFGHSASVQQLFNADSFIDCSQFGSLRKCAERVLHVFRSPQLYQQMRQQPPIVNQTAFEEAFGWHPDVSSAVIRPTLDKLFGRLMR